MATTRTRKSADKPAPRPELEPLRPVKGAIGQHDTPVLEAVLKLLAESEKPEEGVTTKAVAEATNLRVRVLENTLWRLSDQGGKYHNPPLIRDNTRRPVVFRLAD